MIEEPHAIASGGRGKSEREGGVEEDSASEEDWASQAFDFVAVGGLRNLTQLRAGLLRSLLSYLLWSGWRDDVTVFSRLCWGGFLFGALVSGGYMKVKCGCIAFSDLNLALPGEKVEFGTVLGCITWPPDRIANLFLVFLKKNLFSNLCCCACPCVLLLVGFVV
uniref:Uncharacterized protein n=1 Tax=Physcomitrium patens TaxID=3218 RepID=A0A7I3ZNL0_PHYPA